MTKQFVALFILVVVAIVAVVTFVNIAILETYETYDLSGLVMSILSFLDKVLVKLGEQDVAVDAFIAEATSEVQLAEAELFFWNAYVPLVFDNPGP